MPTLSLFAACDKVLLDPIADQLSLVGVGLRVFGQAHVNHPSDAPEDVRLSKFVLPELSVVAFWILDETDRGQKFEQLVKIVAEDGKVTEVCEPFSFTMSGDFHRTVQRAVIACRDEGLYRLVLYLKLDGQDDWGEPRGEFPFLASEPQVSRMSVTVKDEPKLLA